MIPFIKKLLMQDTSPALYDAESATAIEATAKLQASMNSLIEATNKFADNVNTTLNQFIENQTANDSTFQVALRQEFQDFIDTVDIKVRALESAVSNTQMKLDYVRDSESLFLNNVDLEDTTPYVDQPSKFFDKIIVNNSGGEGQQVYHPKDPGARKLIDDLFSAKTKQDNQNESFRRSFMDIVSTLTTHKEILDDHDAKINSMGSGGAGFASLEGIKAGEDIRFIFYDRTQMTAIETFEIQFSAIASSVQMVFAGTVYLKPEIEGDSYIELRSATEDENYGEIYLSGSQFEDLNKLIIGFMPTTNPFEIESVGTIEVLSSTTNITQKLTDGAIRLSFFMDYLK